LEGGRAFVRARIAARARRMWPPAALDAPAASARALRVC